MRVATPWGNGGDELSGMDELEELLVADIMIGAPERDRCRESARSGSQPEESRAASPGAPQRRRPRSTRPVRATTTANRPNGGPGVQPRRNRWGNRRGVAGQGPAPTPLRRDQWGSLQQGHRLQESWEVASLLDGPIAGTL